MDKGLKINGDLLEFNKWAIGDIWSTCITPSFKVKFDDIKIIAISPRIALDDEMLLVSLIDKEKNFRQFSHFEFEKEAFDIFNQRLNLDNTIVKEWQQFSYEDHQNYVTDRVIYPQSLYGENLFVTQKRFGKTITQASKFFSLKKSVSGKFNPKVEKFLSENI